jgi:TetR/AcrR family transcriptional repressor of bet genes
MARKDIKDIRRAQLIEATFDSIAKRGFAETTLADVAKQARLSQGIVNFYFNSKQDLLTATLRHMVEDYYQRSAAAVRRAGPAPAARLDAMISADFDPVIASRKNVTVWYAFWGETRWRPAFVDLCRELSETHQLQTSTIMREIIDSGSYRDLDAAALARGLNAMIDGLWLDILTNPKSCDRSMALEICRTYLGRVFPREFGAQPGTKSAAGAA